MYKMLIAGVVLAVAGSASAVTITSAPYDAALKPGEQLVVTFDAPAAPGFAITGGTVVQGNGSGYAAPAGDATQYLVVGQGETATLTTPLLKSFSMYIGSVDTFNSITFKGANGFEQTISGNDLVAQANGNQSSGDTNRRFYFDFGANRVNQVSFYSGGTAFEFDNIAAGAVPEAATWAMLIAGFGMIGVAARRRRATIVTA